MPRFLLAAAIACAAGIAMAHSWYDPECCSGHDCFPVEPTEVQVLPTGDFLVKRSGEIFHAPGSGKNAQREAKWSKDGEHHLCSPQGDRKSKFHFCLYVPRPADS
jgi:hypothetical protein